LNTSLVNPRVAPLLPDDIWQVRLKIKDHIHALHIDPVEQRVLREEVENLALKLAEASKRHHIRFPIGG
jgi:hypothetical protein